MSRVRVVRAAAMAAIVALVATVLSVAPVVGQTGTDIDGLAVDDRVFVEPGEQTTVDVIGNDPGVDEFTLVPSVSIVGQPDGVVLSNGLDEDGFVLLLASADATAAGVVTGEYRLCFGDQCDNAEITLYVGATACTIAGTTGNDQLEGTGGDDVICGLSGDDTINGRGGDDLIFGWTLG